MFRRFQSLFQRTMAGRKRTTRTSSSRKRNRPVSLLLEVLEDRMVPSTIVWANKSNPANNFASVFGSRAGQATQVVQAAIDSWADVITNFHTSTNKYSVNVSMNPNGTGLGASTNVTSSENGIPTSANISISVGPNSGAYYFLDPTVPGDPSKFDPVDSYYLGNNQNAFAAEATNDTGLRDLYSIVLHEMGHAVGFSSSDTSGNPLLLSSTPYAHDVSNPQGKAAGDDYVFQGPDVTTLLTSDNGGVSNAGYPIHADYYDHRGTYNGKTYIGADDLMVPGIGNQERRLISDSDAFVLKDIYGYDIVAPDTLNNFYVDLNPATGQLTIRGNQFVDTKLGYNASSDQISLARVELQLRTVVQTGTPPPGAATPSVVAAPGWLYYAEVHSIAIYTSSGGSQLNVTGVAGIPTVIYSGGADTINFGAGNTAQTVPGQVTLLATNADIVLRNDPSTAANAQLLVNGNVQMDQPWSALSQITIDTSHFSSSTDVDTVNIQNVGPNTPVTVAMGTGSNSIDVSSLAPAQGGTVAGIDSLLTIQGGGGTLTVDDTGNSTPQAGILTASYVTGLGMPYGIDYSGLGRLDLNLGTGDNDFTIQNTWSTTTTDVNLPDNGGNTRAVNVRGTTGLTQVLVSGNGAGTTISIGSFAPAPGGNVAGIQGALIISGGGSAISGGTLNVNDSGASMGQSGTLEEFSLSGLGMGKGITYSNTARLNLNLGAGDDSFTIQNTFSLTTTDVNLLDNGGATRTVNVRGVAGVTQVVVSGSGAGTIINVGSLGPAQGGNVAGIQGALTIVGNEGTLNVDDTGDSTPQRGSLQPFGLSGLGMSDSITYIGMAQLDISLGSGGNSFSIQNTAAATSTTLNAGTGSDSVSMTALAGPVTLNGQGNSGTSLNVNLHDDFTQSLTVSGFASMSFQTTGNFSGQLLAPTEGTAAAPLGAIDFGGSLTSTGVIKVGFLGQLVVPGDLAGTFKAFGNDPSTPAIQDLTVYGNLTSTGLVAAPSFGTLKVLHNDAGTVTESSPTQDFQSFEIDGSLLATASITAGSGGTLNVQQDLAGNVYILGILDTLIVEGKFTGTVHALQVNHELPLLSNWGQHLVTGQSNLPSGTVTTQTPTFLWAAVAGASSYNLWITDDMTGQMVLSENVSGTSYTLTPAQALSPGDSFAVWAGAENSQGAVTSWGTNWNLTVAALAAPTAQTPSSTVNSDQPTFSWSAGTGSTIAPGSYELYIQDQSRSVAPLIIPNLSLNSASYALTAAQALTPGDSYVWWVGGVSTNGKVIAWSNSVNCSVATMNGTPTAGTLGGTVASDQLTFYWSAGTGTGTAAASYELYFSDQTTGQISTITNLPINSTSCTLTAAQALTPGDSYVWWVGAVSTNGNAIAWSSGVDFTVAAINLFPTAITPNTSVATDLPRFTWGAGFGTGTPAASYELYISDQSTGQVTKVPNLPINSSSFTLTAAQALTPGHSYAWWVGAVSTNGKTIAWSNEVDLNVAAINAVPAATTPDHFITTFQPTFTWSAGAGSGTPAASYELYILDQIHIQVSIIPNLSLSSTSYTLTAAQALGSGQTYEWWVGAVSTNGKVIAWSNGVDFDTYS
jgi:hypothetical protein